MFKSLYAKLSAVFAVLLCLIGIVYLALTLHSTRLYQQEIGQRLNRSLAANLVAGKELMRDGRVDRAMLNEIFHMYMVINPAIEVYLLDTGGRILGFSAPPEKIKRHRVALEPIERFLGPHPQLPVLGDDPRAGQGRKIFSAAPIEEHGRVSGYLYVVLAGQQYESVAALLQGSYIFKLSLGAIIATLLFALVCGLVVFNLLTRRLSRLSQAMEALQRQGFEDRAAAGLVSDSTQDEIGTLAQAFNRMADRIVEQVQALKRTDDLRRELVANVSHDLRTPIASLQGYLETLMLKETELTPEQQRRYIAIALKHGERLGRLTNELFELSRLDAGEVALQREAVALGDLVQDVIAKFQLAAEARGIRLQAQTPESLPLVYGDIGLIERVLQNLIENALEHTPASGTITVTLAPGASEVTVGVEDTGRGIAPEELERIFERFYRSNKDERRGNRGAGLGLAIAKRIVNLHGGDIRASSRLNEGTCFTFPLPILEHPRDQIVTPA